MRHEFRGWAWVVVGDEDGLEMGKKMRLGMRWVEFESEIDL